MNISMNISSGGSMNESSRRYCDENAVCLNQYGSYYCKCNEGTIASQINCQKYTFLSE